MGGSTLIIGSAPASKHPPPPPKKKKGKKKYNINKNNNENKILIFPLCTLTLKKDSKTVKKWLPHTPKNNNKKIVQFSGDPKNIHKIYKTQKIFIFLKTPFFSKFKILN